MALEAFRAEVRAWLEEHCPESMRVPPVGADDVTYGGRRGRTPSPDARRWLDAAAARGFTAPTWPVEYGGAGLDPEHARVLAEEMRRLGCRPPLVSLHGLGMIGPVLLEYGTDEQRARFLPPTARGDIRWCQGFSEPGAGSDLAGVTTTATRDGDEYVVAGEKVWTSFADEADWIFVLVRTDRSKPKREGLGFLLIAMDSPGVSVRPITLLSGRSEFCSVHFDSVRVPAPNLVGSEHDGWKITQAVLARERRLLGDPSQRTAPRNLVAAARAELGTTSGPLPDAGLRDAIAAVEIERECCRALLRSPGRRGSPHPSVVKLALSELMQHESAVAARVAGTRSLGWAGPAFSDADLAATRDRLYSRAWTIGGGSSEIQLNVIARRVLDLPHLGPESR